MRKPPTPRESTSPLPNLRSLLLTFSAAILLLAGACSGFWGTSAPIPNSQSLNECLPAGAALQVAAVVKIVDGDTIQVLISGRRLTVRYIGINAPEWDEPLGPAATNRNAQLVNGKQVILVKDTSETDSYGRLLRYVFVDGIFVNQRLAREGLADARSYPPDTACQKVLFAAEDEFKLLGAPTSAPPTTGGCPQGCSQHLSGCDIKGNINDRGDKLYHLPGNENYAATTIDPTKGERWFCTVTEAQANGWKPAR